MKVSKGFLFVYVMIAVTCVIPFVYFYINIFGTSLSALHERWAQFGDYIGGVLTSVLAFISFIALLHTIVIQKNELELTREELTRSASAQETTANFAEQQNGLATEQFSQLKRNEQKNDLYRFVELIEKKIENRMQKTVMFYLNDHKVTIEFLIIRLLDDIEKRPEFIKEKLDDKYDIDFEYLFFQINELLRMSLELKEISDNDRVYTYYEKLYEKELKLRNWWENR